MTDELEQEIEYRNVAWEVISRMSIANLLEDCVEALVEAYQLVAELYAIDKELVEDKEPEEQDVNTTQ